MWNQKKKSFDQENTSIFIFRHLLDETTKFLETGKIKFTEWVSLLVDSLLVDWNRNDDEFLLFSLLVVDNWTEDGVFLVIIFFLFDIDIDVVVVVVVDNNVVIILDYFLLAFQLTRYLKDPNYAIYKKIVRGGL